MMNAHAEYKLKEAAREILVHARGGDWEHTLRSVDYGKYLLEHEKGDPEIVIPALYLHDIGWSKVDFSDFKQAAPGNKDEAVSVRLHMQYGAELAVDILSKLEYDPSTRNSIVSIIAVHDDINTIFAMNDPSATLVVEADRLDRYGLESLKRYKAMFGKAYLTGNQLEEAKRTRQDGLKKWFRTPTAVGLATKLAKEMGWLDMARGGIKNQ
jgi:HD superfamily phosphodiesterase